MTVGDLMGIIAVILGVIAIAIGIIGIIAAIAYFKELRRMGKIEQTNRR